MDAQTKDAQDDQDLDPEIPALTNYAPYIIQQNNRKGIYTALLTATLSLKVTMATEGNDQRCYTFRNYILQDERILYIRYNEDYTNYKRAKLQDGLSVSTAALKSMTHCLQKGQNWKQRASKSRGWAQWVLLHQLDGQVGDLEE